MEQRRGAAAALVKTLLGVGVEAPGMPSYNAVPATPKAQAQALAYVDGLKAAGHTRAQEALEKAFTYPDATAFVFLSDGSPFKNGQLLPTGPIVDAVRHANRFRRIVIHSISFPGANVPFMRELAEKTKGTYRYVGEDGPKL